MISSVPLRYRTLNGVFCHLFHLRPCPYPPHPSPISLCVMLHLASSRALALIDSLQESCECYCTCATTAWILGRGLEAPATLQNYILAVLLLERSSSAGAWWAAAGIAGVVKNKTLYSVVPGHCLYSWVCSLLSSECQFSMAGRNTQQ